MKIAHKILHINSSKDLRGGERQTRLLIDGLAERGWENYLAVRADSPFSKTNGLLVKGVFPVKMRGEMDILAGFQIGKFAKDSGIEIIHCHTALAHTLGIYAQMVCGAKLVVTRRVDFELKGGVVSLWKYKRADHIVAISRRIYDILSQAGIEQEKLSLIPSGVKFGANPRQLKVMEMQKEMGLSDANIVIGTVAALVGHKDYPTLLHAFKIVLDKYPQALLLCLGGGDDLPQLENLAQNLGIADKIKFLGFRDDVVNFYGLFNVYVQSSKMEGLCTSLIEAMFYGLPIAACSAGGIPDLIDHEVTGLLSPPQNPPALAENIIRLIADPELSTALSSCARVKSLDYSAENMVSGNEKVYLRLLNAE